MYRSIHIAMHFCNQIEWIKSQNKELHRLDQKQIYNKTNSKESIKKSQPLFQIFKMTLST